MLKDENAVVRKYAARVLGKMGPASGASVPALIEVLKDRDDFVRWTASNSLEKIGAEAIPDLIHELKDEDDSILWTQKSVANVLGRIGPEAVSALIGSLKDKDSGLRGNAAGALGRQYDQKKRCPH